MDKRRIMVIAGEASGDLHASHLVRAIGTRAPDIEFVGIGGARMKEAGVELIYDNRELAVTGFTEVLSKVRTIWQAYREVKTTLQRLRPDLLILLDFPDFNFMVGKAAKKMGIPVVYYISPQVWAWRQGRIAVIRKMVKKILVILPFEASLYGDKGVFVGHPLLDEIGETGPPEEIRKRYGVETASRVVALLPGSRRNEVVQLLPVMVKAAELIEKRFPGTAFLIPVAPTIGAEDIAAEIAKSPVPLIPVQEKAYDTLRIADFAVVASGTATLETAIMGTPMVILYRVSPFTFFLAKRLVKVPHIGLINMVAGERIVPELLQNDVTPEAVAAEAVKILEDREYARRVTEQLKEASDRLGRPGASRRAAEVVVDLMEAAP